FRAKLQQVRSVECSFVTWGYHECEFCGKARSSSEFEVPGLGVVYCAPDMITHYVEEHEYRPPQEFIDAVLVSPPPGTSEYRSALDAILISRVRPAHEPSWGPRDPWPDNQVDTSSVQYPVLTLLHDKIARRDSPEELSYGKVHDLIYMRGFEIIDLTGRRLF